MAQTMDPWKPQLGLDFLLIERVADGPFMERFRVVLRANGREYRGEMTTSPSLSLVVSRDSLTDLIHSKLELTGEFKMPLQMSFGW